MDNHLVGIGRVRVTDIGEDAIPGFGYCAANGSTVVFLVWGLKNSDNEFSQPSLVSD